MKKLLLFSSAFLMAIMSFSQLTQINSNKSLVPTYPLANGKTILVSDIDSFVWVTDGTLAGTIQLSTNIKLTETGGLVNGKLIFSGTTAATGEEIFVTDGTAAGTILLSDINPGATGSNPDVDFALLNGFIYFTASRPAEGRELWRTDGTPGGTAIFKDIVAGATGSNSPDSFNLFSNGTYLLFAAKIAATGTELWTSNGTSGGTVALADIRPGTGSSFPENFTILNNLVLFQANDGTRGVEYWKTNGTPGGTTILKDINPGPGNMYSFANLPFPHIFNNKAFFIANNGVNGDEVWATDGTEANTFLLKDIQTSPFVLTSVINAITVGNKFFFTSSDLISRFEIWQSDGTTAGTTLFKAFSPVSSSGSPLLIKPYQVDLATGTLTQPLFQGNKFFFTAGTMAEGVELWVSDGTLAGTVMVKNIGPGAIDGVNFTSYAYTSANFYFAADNAVNGLEVWRSNGTDAGTSLLADINVGAADSEPEYFFYINNGKLLLNATNGDNAAFDLYVLDGVLPLPVNLLQFTVNAKQGDAFLQWSTSREVNSRDFIIERSDDGSTFTGVGNVSASGTSTSTINYMFNDVGIMNSGKSKLYYRLNQRNKDGTQSYSRVITLNVKGASQFTIRLLQNPASGILPIMVNGVKEGVQLSIKDLGGRTLYVAPAAKINGFTSVPVNQLAAGTYVLVAEDGAERKTFKFIKQ